MNVLSVDPGSKCLGWALFHNGSLANGGIERRPTGWTLCAGALGARYASSVGARHDGRRLGPTVVLYEQMRVYDMRRQKGDPNDLVELATVAGAFAGYLESAFGDVSIEAVPTATWKGQVPKDIMVKRIQGRCTDAERERAEGLLKGTPASLHHNFWDAVGMGLWRLGRF